MCLGFLKKKIEKVSQGLSSKGRTEPKETMTEHSELATENQFMRLNRVNATLRANKLISLIFSYLDYKTDNKNKTGFIYVEIPYSKINNYVTKSGVAYNDDSFKDIAKDIIHASIVSGKLKGSEVVFPIIDYVRDNQKEKTYTFRVNDVFVPYVQQLKSKYSVLQLETIKGFKSNHAFVLYQELMSWYDHDRNKGINIKERYYTTSDLFKLFNLDKSDYHLSNGKLDRYNFEKRVIQKAVDDINDQGEIAVTWEKVREKNVVKAYNFTYMSHKDKSEYQERQKNTF